MKHNVIESAFDIEAVRGQGVFEGYASVFNHTDSVHDRVEKGAFKDSLAQYKAKGRLPALLWQHDTQEPIGKWMDIYEDNYGLYVRGMLFIDDIDRARQAYRLISEQAMNGLSIGFKALESYKDSQTAERVLTKIELLEISLVTFPALDTARVSNVKQTLKTGSIPDERSLEAFLREAGFSRKQAKAFIASGYKSLGPRDVGRADPQTSDLQALRNLADRLHVLAQI